MKIGDIVKYNYSKYRPGMTAGPKDDSDWTGLILYVNQQGGTLKVLDKFGKVDWFVTSYCEVISESR